MFGIFSSLEIWLHLICSAIQHNKRHLTFVGVFYSDKFNTQMDFTYKEKFHLGGTIFINGGDEPMYGNSEDNIANRKQTKRNKERLSEIQRWYG